MNTRSSSSQLVRMALSLASWILIAAVPVMLIGLSFEETAREWVQSLTERPSQLLWVSFVLLASDILLPIPSSFVCTLCGQTVGWWNASAVCAAGMMLGSIIGFAFSRTWGRRLAEKLTSPESLALLDRNVCHTGMWWLIVLRPLPILAEAAVLLSGVHRLSWSQFLLAVGTSSLATAAAFSLLGTISQHGQWTVVAWIASVIVPLCAMWVCRFLLKMRQ